FFFQSDWRRFLKRFHQPLRHSLVMPGCRESDLEGFLFCLFESDGQRIKFARTDPSSKGRAMHRAGTRALSGRDERVDDVWPLKHAARLYRSTGMSASDDVIGWRYRR